MKGLIVRSGHRPGDGARIADRGHAGGPSSSSDALLRLQRSAGNAAVSEMVQRYASGEHASQGDRAPGSQRLTIGKETLTSGEVNALADLYGRPEDLLKANPVELAAVLALVRREAAGGAVKEEEWDTATNGRYTKLNLKNAAHFAPRDPALISPPASAGAAGDDNVATFLRYYAETVTTTFQSVDVASTDPGKAKELSDRAAVTAGFAEHFLMDAFSAGHLINKDDFIAKLKENLDALPAGKLTALFEAVANGVLADPASKSLLDTYESADAYHLGWHPNFSRAGAFKVLLEELYKDPDGKQAVYSGLVKFVHDQLSTRNGGSGLVGVEVQNKFETWVMSGDKTLAKSPDTQRVIEQAMTRFRALVKDYRMAPRSMASPIADADQVTDYFPHPTPASATMISALVTKVTDPAGGAAASLISVVKAELPAIMLALLARGKIRRA
ncbi:hypothetical protein ACPPVT_01745 [Angustibacter sp. McL0619]|uniref:hypothetical protein n=1 Tax=Angustibacter sp. McL0619 TaxID=3415676 RepID=UPI003CF944EA